MVSGRAWVRITVRVMVGVRSRVSPVRIWVRTNYFGSVSYSLGRLAAASEYNVVWPFVKHRLICI